MSLFGNEQMKKKRTQRDIERERERDEHEKGFVNVGRDRHRSRHPRDGMRSLRAVSRVRPAMILMEANERASFYARPTDRLAFRPRPAR